MEKVLVVNSDLLTNFLGNTSFVTANISRIVHRIYEYHTYIDRDTAEYSREYKQIIPYAILRNGNSFFLTKRLSAQTEKRLHGMYSIGLGGHINPSEEKENNVIIAGLKRELYEEVGVEDVTDCRCVGVLNDCSTEVSNYHIGLVYIIDTNMEVNIKETSKMTGQWVSSNEIGQIFDNLETWSQIVWENKSKWEN